MLPELQSTFSQVAPYAGYAAVAVASTYALAWAGLGWGTTHPNQKSIIHRFGHVKRVNDPGLYFKQPWDSAILVDIDSKVEDEPLSVVTKDTNGTQLPVKIYWHTEDPISYRIKVENAEEQMCGLIHEAIRGICSGMHSDDLFTDREQIKKEVMEDPAIILELERLGIKLDNVVIDEPLLPGNVIKAKNDIRQGELDAQVAEQQTIALRTRIVGEAQAKMEARDLEGQGAAKFKTNMLKGLANEAKELVAESGGTLSFKDAMGFVLGMLELEVRETAAESTNKVFFMPTGQGTGVNFSSQEIIAALEAAKEQNNQQPAARAQSSGPSVEL